MTCDITEDKLVQGIKEDNTEMGRKMRRNKDTERG